MACGAEDTVPTMALTHKTPQLLHDFTALVQCHDLKMLFIPGVLHVSLSKSKCTECLKQDGNHNLIHMLHISIINFNLIYFLTLHEFGRFVYLKSWCFRLFLLAIRIRNRHRIKKACSSSNGSVRASWWRTAQSGTVILPCCLVIGQD